MLNPIQVKKLIKQRQKINSNSCEYKIIENDIQETLLLCNRRFHCVLCHQNNVGIKELCNTNNISQTEISSQNSNYCIMNHHEIADEQSIDSYSDCKTCNQILDCIQKFKNQDLKKLSHKDFSDIKNQLFHSFFNYNHQILLDQIELLTNGCLSVEKSKWNQRRQLISHNQIHFLQQIQDAEYLEKRHIMINDQIKELEDPVELFNYDQHITGHDLRDKDQFDNFQNNLVQKPIPILKSRFIHDLLNDNQYSSSTEQIISHLQCLRDDNEFIFWIKLINQLISSYKKDVFNVAPTPDEMMTFENKKLTVRNFCITIIGQLSKFKIYDQKLTKIIDNLLQSIKLDIKAFAHINFFEIQNSLINYENDHDLIQLNQSISKIDDLLSKNKIFNQSELKSLYTSVISALIIVTQQRNIGSKGFELDARLNLMPISINEFLDSTHSFQVQQFKTKFESMQHVDYRIEFDKTYFNQNVIEIPFSLQEYFSFIGVQTNQLWKQYYGIENQDEFMTVTANNDSIQKLKKKIELKEITDENQIKSIQFQQNLASNSEFFQDMKFQVLDCNSKSFGNFKQY